MKIKAIIIQNFQIHKKKIIYLKDFNIILGNSSSGKSAIFRALNFLFYGEWDSTYPNDPEKATGVGIIFDNDIQVIRLRKKNENKAMIVYPDGNKEVFKSFGDVIPKLNSLINISKIGINDKKMSLQFSFQDDPLFMVSESKTTRAHMLNRLTGINIINEMIKLAQKEKRNKETEKKIISQKIEEMENNPIIKLDIKQIENKVNEIKTKIAKAKQWEELKERMNFLINKEKNIKKYAFLENVHFDEINQNIEKIQKLTQITQKMAKIQEKRKNLGEDVYKFDVVQLKIKSERVLLLNSIYDRVKSTRGILAGILSEYKLLNAKINKIKEIINNNLFKDNMCPICNSPIQNHEMAIYNMQKIFKK